MWHFCTKGGQLGPHVCDDTLLHQRRSVKPQTEAQCRWNVLQKCKKDIAKILKFSCRNTEVLLQKSLFSVVQPIWFSSSSAFHGSSSVFMIFHGSRLVFHGYPWCQVGFSWFQVGFHGSRSFLWLFMVPGWFFIIFHGSRWVIIIFHGSRLAFHGFHGSRWAFMVFHGSRLVFMVPRRLSRFFMVPGCFFHFSHWEHP